MSNDPKFIDGLIVKAPHERAPEYVKAKLSIKREELIAWLQQQDGEWINADVKVSQQGKWYCAIDDWKPNQGGDRQPRMGKAEMVEKFGQVPAPKRAAPANDFADDDSTIPF